jgi:membrane protein implicated in regulation of membrane protease activity
MAIEFIRSLGAWTWVIVGVILLAVELAAPGAFFMWFGLAAIGVGVFALVVAIPWQAQSIIFVVLAALVVLIGRRYFARSARQAVPTGLNERGRRLIGTVAVIGEPIVDGTGRVRIDDTTWRITGPDMPSGTRVRIVAADGALLTVTPFEDPAESSGESAV